MVTSRGKDSWRYQRMLPCTQPLKKVGAGRWCYAHLFMIKQHHHYFDHFLFFFSFSSSSAPSLLLLLLTTQVPGLEQTLANMTLHSSLLSHILMKLMLFIPFLFLSCLVHPYTTFSCLPHSCLPSLVCPFFSTLSCLPSLVYPSLVSPSFVFPSLVYLALVYYFSHIRLISVLWIVCWYTPYILFHTWVWYTIYWRLQRCMPVLQWLLRYSQHMHLKKRNIQSLKFCFFCPCSSEALCRNSQSSRINCIQLHSSQYVLLRNTHCPTDSILRGK